MIQNFGKSVTVNIAESGTIPLVEGPRPSDTPRLLGLLGPDNFWVVIGTYVGNKNILKVIIGKLVTQALIEHRGVMNSNTFPKSVFQASVASAPICDGLQLRDFFDTKEKAESAVGNVINALKITRKTLYQDSSEFELVADLWDIICTNGSPRSAVHGYLRLPSGAPPIVNLFGGYDQEKVDRLSSLIEERNHRGIVTLVAGEGILTESVIRYLHQI